jgi:hypothetical protein
MQQVYLSKQRKGSDPWDLPDQKPGCDTEGTIFSHRYLSITIDEVHAMRNTGVKYFSALRIFKQGVLKLALTATPLLTAPKVRIFFYYATLWLLGGMLTFIGTTDPGHCLHREDHWRS